jgi:hypothetical protein
MMDLEMQCKKHQIRARNAEKAGGNVVQKCTTLVPKIAGMASCGAFLHHICHFSRKSSECSAKMHHLASMPV